MIQSFWFMLGAFVLVALTLTDYRVFSDLSITLYILNVLFLVFVLKFGVTRNFSTRWINLGFFLFQPSESMKLVLAFVLANYFSSLDEDKAIGFKKLAYPFILTLIPAFLIKKQPDLGSAALLFVEFGVLMFMAKIKLRVWGTIVIIIVVLLPLFWFFVLNGYHKKRIDAFMNPEKFAKTIAYQTIQAKFAIGSGKLKGKGFNKGPISKGKFVPEQETDFAFSVWAEEFGFIGSTFLISLYIILILFLFFLVKDSSDMLGFYLSISIISYFVFQILLNLLMVTGMFPVIGVPLPLFSYGGTNMLVTMGSLGVLFSIYVKRESFD